ncbi:MAG TPA: hypothetical protein PLI12_02350 [Acetobacteraceae bacterium]|nr:hypothetical protein [Acetobacteraceae bacterium]
MIGEGIGPGAEQPPAQPRAMAMLGGACRAGYRVCRRIGGRDSGRVDEQFGQQTRFAETYGCVIFVAHNVSVPQISLR